MSEIKADSDYKFEMEMNWTLEEMDFMKMECELMWIFGEMETNSIENKQNKLGSWREGTTSSWTAW